MNLDDYAREKANSTALRCRSATEDGYACEDCIERAIKAAYQHGAADQKRGAVQALQDVKNIRYASESPIIYKHEALKAVSDSTSQGEESK